MKNYFIKQNTLLFLLFFQLSYGQVSPPDWNSMMTLPNANYYDIKNKVNNYFLEPIGIVKKLEINYCTRKLRASLYGRGMWESDLITSSVNLTQSASPWTGSKTIDNDVVVPSGVNFSINAATITVASGRKIIVNNGGILTITNSTLKSCSNL
jgi:hypothetical protein